MIVIGYGEVADMAAVEVHLAHGGIPVPGTAALAFIAPINLVAGGIKAQPFGVHRVCRKGAATRLLDGRNRVKAHAGITGAG